MAFDPLMYAYPGAKINAAVVLPQSPLPAILSQHVNRLASMATTLAKAKATAKKDTLTGLNELLTINPEGTLANDQEYFNKAIDDFNKNNQTLLYKFDKGEITDGNLIRTAIATEKNKLIALKEKSKTDNEAANALVMRVATNAMMLGTDAIASIMGELKAWQNLPIDKRPPLDVEKMYSWDVNGKLDLVKWHNNKFENSYYKSVNYSDPNVSTSKDVFDENRAKKAVELVKQNKNDWNTAKNAWLKQNEGKTEEDFDKWNVEMMRVNTGHQLSSTTEIKDNKNKTTYSIPTEYKSFEKDFSYSNYNKGKIEQGNSNSFYNIPLSQIPQTNNFAIGQYQVGVSSYTKTPIYEELVGDINSIEMMPEAKRDIVRNNKVVVSKGSIIPKQYFKKVLKNEYDIKPYVKALTYDKNSSDKTYRTTLFPYSGDIKNHLESLKDWGTDGTKYINDLTKDINSRGWR